MFAESATAITSELSGRVYLVAQQDRTHSTIPLKCQYFPQQVYAAAASFLPFWFMFSIQYLSCLFIHMFYICLKNPPLQFAVRFLVSNRINYKLFPR